MSALSTGLGTVSLSGGVTGTNTTALVNELVQHHLGTGSTENQQLQLTVFFVYDPKH